MSEYNFDELVKRRKAIEWLMKNNPGFRASMLAAGRSVFTVVDVAFNHSDWIRDIVNETAKQMEVTERDRLGLVVVDGSLKRGEPSKADDSSQSETV